MKNCAIIIIISLIIIILLDYCLKKENYVVGPKENQCKCDNCLNKNCPKGQPNFPIGSDQLIGMVYAPRAGPLQTNYEFPKSDCACPRAFTALYNKEPFIQQFK
jgi:hypothetical protein